MSLLPLFGFLLYSIYADRVMSVVCAGVRWTIVQCNEATQGTSLLSEYFNQVDMASQLKVQINHVKAAVGSHAATEVISD